MKTIVENIISKIKRGVFFDSHFIIDTIIKDYSNEYLKFVKDHYVATKTTEFAHSELAKIISSSKFVKKHENQSYSYNIRGKASLCALWERK